MKKIALRSLLVLTFLLIVVISYLSIFGIETNKFNNQIKNKIKGINKNLDLEINQLKLTLEPLKLKINAKTLGPKLKYKDTILDLQSIKTQISIDSLINEKFSLSNLEISTKSVQIKELISFARIIKRNPELYILERFIKKGYLIADVKLDFDEKGKIKKNYSIIGFIKDAKIDLFKSYRFDRLNLNFEVKNQSLNFQDIRLTLNELALSSEKIQLKRKNDSYFVEGNINNIDSIINRKNINLFIQPFISDLNIKKINFNSKNKFSFDLSKKYKIKNFELFSEIKINELYIENNYNLKKFFPEIGNDINFLNHKIKLNVNKKKLVINGNGSVKLQKSNDKIEYIIKKEKEKFIFSSFLEIKDNDFLIDILNYKKKAKSKLKINFDGIYIIDEKVIFNSIILNENKNRINLDTLIFDENFKIKDIKRIDLNYLDYENRKNELFISKKKNDFVIIGSSFNANSLIENLLKNDDEKKLNIFKRNFNFDLEIDTVFLDKVYEVKNLKGNFLIEKNDILNASLIASFPDDRVLKLTIDTNQEGKITTLFLDNAEPIVKRYKFIKGYESGSLDFYSLKKEDKTMSTLKIYDFKLKELPVLTKLLTLASLQGIADILSGEGIRFNEFEMIFENQKKLMTIKEIYAIGPAISVLMDGYVEKDKVISLRGTLVPATTLNKVIGSIPFLGKILVGSKSGEGVFGVSFKIKGPPKNLETTVNPIKTLTPRFITRTLEKIKKN